MPIAFTPTSAVAHVSECEFFSSNCSKFVIECDWNNKNSQNVQILGFFERKMDGFFEKKSWTFSKIAKGCKFAVECVSNGIISLNCLFRPHYEVFGKKSENFERWKN